jgi:uncharacterized delta-60 repeat protein
MGFIRDNTNSFEVYLTDLGKQKFFEDGFKDSISYFSISDTDSNYTIFNPALNEIIPFEKMSEINIGDVVSYITINSVNDNTDGTIDNTFNIGTGVTSGFNNYVKTLALQPDGKILVGGDFTSYSGVTRNRIIRLNSDSTIDNTFNIGNGFTDGLVWSIALQPDGKILVGGGFTSYSGVTRNYIIRLNSDGTIDNTFNIGTGTTGGFNVEVNTIALQPDGKILVGGAFTSYSGVTSNRIIRLNTGGTIDNTFTIGNGFDGTVTSIIIQPDGKILVGGIFAIYNSVPRNRIIRLNSDGTIDNTFNINIIGSSVGTIALQPDGKILVGGDFLFNITRLNNDGTVDNTFNVGDGFDNYVKSITLQPDGKILAGGAFTSYNGTYANKIIRLNFNGNVDNFFNIGAGFTSFGTEVEVLQSQPDGKILVGGTFDVYDGIVRNNIIRLNTKFNYITKYFRKIKDFNDYDEVPYFNTKSTINNEYWEEIFPFDSVNINPQPIQILNHNNTKKTSLPILDNVINPINVYLKHDQDISFSITSGGNTIYQPNSPFDSFLDYGRINNVFNDNQTITINGCSSSIFDKKNINIKVYLDSGLLIDSLESNDNCITLNQTLSNNNNYYISASKILFNSGFNNYVTSITLQPDGKILVGGDFTTYNGATRNRIIRLNSDGTIDNTFNIGPGTAGGFTGEVRTITLQPDGKILVGGNFITYNGISRSKIIRLTTGGTPDLTFSIGTGFPSGNVNTIALQPNNKILVGGLFSLYNGAPRNNIIRLDDNGFTDATFTIGTGFTGEVRTITLQPDGKILAGGTFTSYSGVTSNRIIRLNTGGTIDNTFTIGNGFDSAVSSIALQPDGKILVGGNFTSYSGVTSNRIIRLNTGGTIDNTFNIGTGFTGEVRTIKLQPDGKILVGGAFTSYSGVTSNRIIRLNTGGTIDSTFDTKTTTTIGGFDNYVSTLALQTDGKVLAGGDFTSYQLASINRIGRLNSNGSNDNKFNVIDDVPNLRINVINDIFTQTTLRGDIVDGLNYRNALFGIKNKIQKDYVMFEPDYNSDDTLSILTYTVNE